MLLGINPFDQWGMELGKEIAGQMQGLLASSKSEAEFDSATVAAASAWREANQD